jgi:hypothetical protein
MLLKTNVHTRARGLRPTVELEPTDHPLAVEQREASPKRIPITIHVRTPSRYRFNENTVPESPVPPWYVMP